jgi:very-short-patch-repair endonuclease
VITHAQLVALGYSAKAIKHRLATGRLFRIYEGVYAVGRKQLTQEGRWIAAVLACGEDAALSHESAAALWGIARTEGTKIHVSVLSQRRSRDDIEVHRRQALDATTRDGIRVTTPAQTLIDLGARPDIEQLIGEADLRGLVRLGALRTAATKAGRPGAPLRSVIERLAFRVTQSELERAFLRLVAEAGLPLPDTQTRIGRTRVDFFWSGIGLVVETDGARFHANAVQQTADRKRDQAHTRAGRTPMRITHTQVFYEPSETATLLAEVVQALSTRS